MKRSFALIVFLAAHFLYGQDKVIDSLRFAIKQATADTTKVRLLSEIGEVCDEKDILQYADISQQLCEKNLAKTKEKEQRKFFLMYLAKALNNVGYVANYRGDIPKSLECLHKSLKIYEEMGDQPGLASSLNNIGFLYKNQGELEKALEFYFRSLKIREGLDDKERIALNLNNIASVYNVMGKTSKAMEYQEKCFAIQVSIGDSSGMTTSLFNMGLLYDHHLKEYAKAMEYYQKSLVICKITGDKEGMVNILNRIGDVYLLTHEPAKALGYCKQSFDIARSLGYPESIKRVAETLKRIYKEQRNFGQALAMYELEMQMRDSITNVTNRKASIKQQLKYEYEKKAAADSVKVEEEKKIVAVQLKQEQTQRYALYGGLGLVGLFAIFMVNRFRVTNKQKKLIQAQKTVVEEQKHLVEEKQKEILDSIHYARRIQTALITNEKYITRNLNRLKA